MSDQLVYSPGGYSWLFDAGVNGFDDQIFKVYAGPVSYNANAIAFGNGSAASVTTYLAGGRVTFDMSIPSAPATGANRIWGLYMPNRGNVDAAYFFVSGTNFYTRTYDKNGVVEQQTVLWDPSWTGSRVKWDIIPTAAGVQFVANGVVKAEHGTRVPTAGRLNAPYVSNTSNEADTAFLFTLEYVGCQRILYNEPVFGRGDTTTTTSTSTTTTTSTSTSSSTTTTSTSTTTTSTSTSSTTTTSTSTSTTTTSTSTTTTSTSTSSTTTVTLPDDFNV